MTTRQGASPSRQGGAEPAGHGAGSGSLPEGREGPLAIQEIVTRLVQLPLPEPIRHPFMGQRTQFASLLVEVRTADGCHGIGYASLESVHMAGAVREVVRGLREHLLGQDALARALLHDRMWNLTVDLLHDGVSHLAMAAIDMALWDICGKQAGLPVWQLLGGYRDRVPAYASWTLWRHQSDGRLADEAAALVAQGYRAMKLRLGGGRPLAEDIRRAELVRRTVGPDVQIMVDALWGLTPMEGVRMARALAELDYFWLEEPVREGDFAGLRQVKAENALPIAAGERISRLAMIEQLVPAVDHAILDVSHLGGLTPSLKAAAVLDIHNLPVSTHAYSLISTHLLAGIRTGAWLEYMGWWSPLFEDAPEPVDGWIPMSRKPGLGLTIDEDLVRRHLVD